MLVPDVRETPWGFEDILWRSPAVTVKMLTIRRGERTSLQRHAKRDEHWTVLSEEGGTLEIGGVEREATPGYAAMVWRGSTHRATAPDFAELKILEVSHGEFNQDDIERIEDDYGRC